MLQPTPSPWSRRARAAAPARSVSSEGPPHGDYAHYVEQLLRSSPLYHSAAHRMAQGLASGGFDPGAVPGSQPASPWQQMRARMQDALAQAAAAQAPAPGKVARKPAGKAASARQPAPAKAQAEPAERPWWKPTPLKLLTLVLAAALLPLAPAIGPFLLLLTIGGALRRGWKKAMAQVRSA